MNTKVVDAKGVSVHIDSLVEGFRGSTKQVAKARVTFISQWGWVVGYDPDSPDGAKQPVFAEKRFLVRDEPRPLRQRGDIPERLVRM